MWVSFVNEAPELKEQFKIFNKSDNPWLILLILVTNTCLKTMVVNLM
jgi:hypothetical protein